MKTCGSLEYFDESLMECAKLDTSCQQTDARGVEWIAAGNTTATKPCFANEASESITQSEESKISWTTHQKLMKDFFVMAVYAIADQNWHFGFVMRPLGGSARLSRTALNARKNGSTTSRTRSAKQLKSVSLCDMQ